MQRNLTPQPPTQPIPEHISFTLCATFAILYNELYNGSHYHFIRDDLKRLRKHLSLSETVETTIETFASMKLKHSKASLEGFFKVLSEYGNNESLLNTLLFWAISENGYDARTRAVLESFCKEIKLDLKQYEADFASELRTKASKVSEQLSEEEKEAKKKKKIKRIALISVASIAGAGLTALTAGLAAPLVAAGIGTVFGAGAVAGLSSVATVAIVTTVFGAAGGGLAGYKMNKRVGGLEEFRFKKIRFQNSLHLGIAISGWTGEDDSGFTKPWKRLDLSTEQEALIWESEYLRELGTSMDRLISSAASSGVYQILKLTVLSSLLAAVTLPVTVMSAASLLDNPWSVCTRRARQAGEELATLLFRRVHGNRPVSLIGCSTGSLVVWHCLKSLAEKGPDAYGIISNVVIFGAPVTTDATEWEKVRLVVSGKVINGWSTNDWVLGMLCTSQVCGTHRVNWRTVSDKRCVNVRLDKTISGHTDYHRRMPRILNLINACREDFEVVDFYASTSSSHTELLANKTSSGLRRAFSMSDLHSANNSNERSLFSFSKTSQFCSRSASTDQIQLLR
ncbi:unnamed protein product [Oikopleura dioica]|uniref:Uncharacterized protein n=1 Tax=Oikopleura dioica TaxID=34765 RepID=E4XQ94_OIKDI|nr:unnamed protein product [Oikopleura dioica]